MDMFVVGIPVVLALAVGGYFAYKKFFNKEEETAELTLAVGDVNETRALPEALDAVTGVVIGFTEVQLQPEDGDRLKFKVTKSIDLLNNTGNELLNEQEVPAGKYEWIRLVVDAAHVVMAGEEAPLDIPSGVLKLNRGFEVGEGGADFMIDFNLEKSLKVNKKGMFMSPVLALVDNGPVPAPVPEVEEEVVVEAAPEEAAE